LSVDIEPSQLLGKAFEVEIGQVGDESFSTNSATTSGSGKRGSNTLESLVNMADPVTDDDALEFDSDEKEEEYRL
jgi:hypothetical protein